MTKKLTKAVETLGNILDMDALMDKEIYIEQKGEDIFDVYHGTERVEKDITKTKLVEQYK